MSLRPCGLIVAVLQSMSRHRKFPVPGHFLARLRGAAAKLGTQVLDVLFPRTCMLCGEAVPGDEALCSACSGRFEKITGPVCTRCGAVFNSPHGGDHMCGDCIAGRVHYDCARSAVVYAGELRRAVQQFKFNRRSMFAEPFAELLSDRCGPIGPHRGYAALVPVPLHPQRLCDRGYNQSLLLALRLGRKWNVPVERDYLRRTAWSVPQASLRRSQRRRAVRGVFTCSSSCYAGTRLLLIDDVFTSGATVDECARTLKHYGAAAVDVLTVARTLKDYPGCQ